MPKLIATHKTGTAVKFPGITLDSGYHEDVCLLDVEAVKKYDCGSIGCDECYFCAKVYTELKDEFDVSD